MGKRVFLSFNQSIYIHIFIYLLINLLLIINERENFCGVGSNLCGPDQFLYFQIEADLYCMFYKFYFVLLHQKYKIKFPLYRNWKKTLINNKFSQNMLPRRICCIYFYLFM